MKDMRIAIIGAGISGLVAASALQRLGFKPSVYERVTELGEVGAGLTLAPNAMHALNSIGLADRLASGLYSTRSAICQRRTFPSKYPPVVTVAPSGENDTLLADPSWPRMGSNTGAPSADHSLTAPSSPAEARRVPSGENASERTQA